MINLIIYIIIFLILFIGSCFCFIIFNKKYKHIHKNFNQKILIYSVCSTMIISLFATGYCVSLFFLKNDKILSISRPNVGEGDSTISMNIDSEIYSGTINIQIQEQQITFEEAIEIFSKYREELDHYVLGNNTSFCEVTTPLNFPSTIGTENITISWYISDPNIIDYTGNILFNNLSSDNSNLEIIATLKLGEHTAEICYDITVKTIPPTPEEQLSKYINSQINNSSLLNKKNIDLPSNMDGITLDFYNSKNSYPPIYFSFNNYRNSVTNYYT